MLDILAALRWTRENIENFGGDPDNIMVWGESGGGAKTAAILGCSPDRDNAGTAAWRAERMRCRRLRGRHR
ncbi:carboxylesterase family protein [[Actinomadura] parvosata]|uniref:carboxylesterase family protein n=1 Tax=[Actinomadura] parvosata TaxID=1955412 RepID=UPI00406CC70B